MTKTTMTYGDLHDYATGEYLRPATKEERTASRDAARSDGGSGVILVDSEGDILRCDDRGADDARRCYVQE